MNDVKKNLMKAAKGGDEAELEAMLLRLGCDPASKNGSGMTALMFAAAHGRTSCANLLIPMGDALAKDNDGWTALMWAARSGHASRCCFRWAMLWLGIRVVGPR